MKIVVSVLDNKISPRFDSTYKFMVVSVNETKINDMEDIVLSTINPIQRVNELADMGIDTVICGVVNEFTLSLLVKKGINVVPGVIGNIEEVLNLFLNGNLRPGLTIFPDGRKIYRKLLFR